MITRPRLAIAAIATLLLVGRATPADAQEHKLVAHASAGVAELSAAVASKIFLKQERKLPSGVPAVPVDLTKISPVRASFTKAVHARAVGAVEQYWQQQLFSGRDTPPEIKATDEEVLAFVKATPGAVGYVSASATVPAGIIVLTLK